MASTWTYDSWWEELDLMLLVLLVRNLEKELILRPPNFIITWGKK